MDLYQVVLKGATLSINDSLKKAFVESCSSKSWEDAVLSYMREDRAEVRSMVH